MSAEGVLYNPLLFYRGPQSISDTAPSEELDDITYIKGQPYREHTKLALEYLDIVKNLKTKTGLSSVKGHLFKFLRPALGLETDLRAELGKVKGGEGRKDLGGYENVLREYEKIVRAMEARMAVCQIMILFEVFVF